MVRTQRKTLFVAILAAVAAFGIIGPLGARWLGPREASADSSTPILVEDPDGSVFTIPPGEDPEVIADEFDLEPILVVDGPEAFTTSIPTEQSSTTTPVTSSSTTVADSHAETTLATTTTTTGTETSVANSTTTAASSTTTSPVQLNASSAALVTDESSSSQGGLFVVLVGLFLVTISGAAFGWRLRRGSAS